MTAGAVAPSGRLDDAAWTTAVDELIDTLRALIRIPSINPPAPDAPDRELVAARHVAGLLAAAGLEPQVIEPYPGRGSVHARLRGETTRDVGF